MELDERLCVELQPDRFQLFEVEARVLGVTHRSARAERTIKKEVQKYNYSRKRWEKATETSYEPSVDEKWYVEVEFAADGASRKQSVGSASNPDFLWSEIQTPRSKAKIEPGDTVRLHYNPALNEVHPKSDWEGIRRERLQLAAMGISKRFYEQDLARGPETWMFWLAGVAGVVATAVLLLILAKRRRLAKV